MINNKYNLIYIIKLLGFKNFIHTALDNLFKINYYYILQIKTSKITPHDGKFKKFVTCIATESDISVINNSIKDLDEASRKEVTVRLMFYYSGFKNCYLAKTLDGEIAYIQWLIYPDENDVIEKYYSNRFYKLRDSQIMIENAFAFPKYRGLGLMRDMSNYLLNVAREKGYDNAILYIGKDKIDVLNDRIKNGFIITKIVKEYKILWFTKRLL